MNRIREMAGLQIMTGLGRRLGLGNGLGRINNWLGEMAGAGGKARLVGNGRVMGACWGRGNCLG